MSSEWKQKYQKNEGLFKSLQQEVLSRVNKIIEEHKENVDVFEIVTRPSGNIKSWNSIEQNYKDGKYKNITSFYDIKDIVGLRVICHCEDDAEQTVTILEGELRKKFDNVKTREIGGRGSLYPYRAKHINFSSKRKTSDNEMNIYGEIQVRTVMSDAWAIQNHKYLYKNEVEGEAQELTLAVSEIMKGCEKLWGLVKKKCKSGDTNINIDVKEIIRTADIITTKLETKSEKKITTEKWFIQKNEYATKELKELNIAMSMEIRSMLVNHDYNFAKSDLRTAAQKSTINTFGWPIGVFIDSREEFRPRVDVDSIYAELAIEENEISGTNTYDYWTLNQNGSFFLLKSLFEETRKPECLFFDTRIVRITETFMYLRNLYSNLGIPRNSQIEVTITHSGLKGKRMSVASQNRHMFSNYSSGVDSIPTTVITSIEAMDTHMVDIVEQYTSPLFEIFNFFKLDRNILEEIVNGYLEGKMK